MTDREKIQQVRRALAQIRTITEHYDAITVHETTPNRILDDHREIWQQARKIELLLGVPVLHRRLRGANYNHEEKETQT